MNYLYGSGEVVAGLALIFLWWGALRLMRTDKPLSTLAFALWPCLFLVWVVGAIVLILHGTGRI